MTESTFRTLIKSLKVPVLAIPVALLLVGLGAVAHASPPTIGVFKIVPVTEGEKGAEGGWFEFSWATEGADRVRLYRDGVEMKGRHQLSSGEVGWPVSMDGGLRSRLKSSAVFQLIASNGDGEESKLFEAGPAATPRPQRPEIAGPRILSFEAEPKTIEAGESVRFSWEIRDAGIVRLADDQGEIESRIVLPSGKLGWPLSMNGAFQDSPTRSTTYVLTAVSKTGKASESLVVTVEAPPQAPPSQGTAEFCRVTVVVRGKYSKFTDAVGVFRGPGRGGEFLFKSPLALVRDHRAKKDAATYMRATINLPAGSYRLVPAGGGEDSAGYFGVIYQPRDRYFDCEGDGSATVSFTAQFAEY